MSFRFFSPWFCLCVSPCPSCSSSFFFLRKDLLICGQRQAVLLFLSLLLFLILFPFLFFPFVKSYFMLFVFSCFYVSLFSQFPLYSLVIGLPVLIEEFSGKVFEISAGWKLRKKHEEMKVHKEKMASCSKFTNKNDSWRRKHVIYHWQKYQKLD